MKFASAQDAGSQFGILYGFSVPDSENSNPHSMIGIKGTAGISSNFSIGGYYYIADHQIGNGGQKFDYSLAGLEAAIQLATGAGATFVAARIGISKVSTNSFGPDLIFSPYHYGVASGYNYSITSWFTMGFEGSFLYSERSTTTSAATEYNLKPFSALSFLVAMQFRL